MPLPSLTILFALIVGTSGLAAQGGLIVQDCKPPKEPFGQLHQGSGTVRFTLRRDGRADTTSLAVTEVKQVTVATLRGVAARTLAACRFDSGSDEKRDRVPATVLVTLTGTRAIVDAAPMTDAPALPLETDTATAFPLAIDDPRLEERPRRLRCAAPPMPGPAPRSRMERLMEDWKKEWMGTLIAIVRIESDGKADKRVQVVSSSNPEATKNHVNWLVGCEYVPGRYLGRIVPSLLRDSIGVLTRPATETP